MATNSTPEQNTTTDNRGDYTPPPVVARQGDASRVYNDDGIEVPR